MKYGTVQFLLNENLKESPNCVYIPKLANFAIHGPSSLLLYEPVRFFDLGHKTSTFVPGIRFKVKKIYTE